MGRHVAKVCQSSGRKQGVKKQHSQWGGSKQAAVGVVEPDRDSTDSDLLATVNSLGPGAA